VTAVPVSVNAMVPVSGTGETVAVNVTCWPAVLVPFDDEIAVAVAVLDTIWLRGEDVEPASFGSPEYAAAIASPLAVSANPGA